ncbi:hypothetical protein Mal4_12160 [Maioricimonas rarisocia]|uniref:Uncharacterized protein n=1 Tax=Maioricimonas rarisocia TaxID=2528026 RepID=A0A517Z367_9PLAN|nr:hypothetical protein Mal4_12160 [Maioricimonas rarisocia]
MRPHQPRSFCRECCRRLLSQYGGRRSLPCVPSVFPVKSDERGTSRNEAQQSDGRGFEGLRLETRGRGTGYPRLLVNRGRRSWQEADTHWPHMLALKGKHATWPLTRPAHLHPSVSPCLRGCLLRSLTVAARHHSNVITRMSSLECHHSNDAAGPVPACMTHLLPLPSGLGYRQVLLHLANKPHFCSGSLSPCPCESRPYALTLLF